MSEIEISIIGAEELSAELAGALAGHDYSEVEGNEIIGVEGGALLADCSHPW